MYPLCNNSSVLFCYWLSFRTIHLIVFFRHISIKQTISTTIHKTLVLISSGFPLIILIRCLWIMWITSCINQTSRIYHLFTVDNFFSQKALLFYRLQSLHSCFVKHVQVHFCQPIFSKKIYSDFSSMPSADRPYVKRAPPVF